MSGDPVIIDVAINGATKPRRNPNVPIQPADIVAHAMAFCARNGFGPSLAIYEPGFLQTTMAYHRAGKLPRGSMAKIYFGGDYGMWGRGLA
jgi:hypothetical protein